MVQAGLKFFLFYLFILVHVCVPECKPVYCTVRELRDVRGGIRVSEAQLRTVVSHHVGGKQDPHPQRAVKGGLTPASASELESSMCVPLCQLFIPSSFVTIEINNILECVVVHVCLPSH